MAETRLESEINAVCRRWAAQAEDGDLSFQSADKFRLLAKRFARYAGAVGHESLAEIDTETARGFITARGRSRHGATSDSALATWHLRRTVLRLIFRTARSLALTATDPTMDILLPPRTRSAARPLTDEETDLVRAHAESRIHRTRHAAAVALADAGAHTGEIGHISVADLDFEQARVWVHGSSKTIPRWCPLDNWQLHVLSERTEAVRSRYPQLSDGEIPLATSGRGTDAQLQARVCVALNDVMTWAGLAGEADLRPASITAHRAAVVFARTRCIEDAALRLGLASLDRAAAAVGHEWRSRPTDEETSQKPRAAKRNRSTGAR